MSIINVKNVNKFYGEDVHKIDILKNIDLNVKNGEFLVIVGESGGGKSTLLSIIGGLDRVSSGNVYWDGTDITKLDEKKLTHFRKEHVGFVFQNYNLIQNLTVLENIEIAAELTDSPLDCKELIRKVGLEGKENIYPSRLSGGEQQRVSICRALVKNPDVIFCDEPTGALDFETGIKILSLLVDMNLKYKKTIILITHNQPIADIADRVIKIRSGEIIDEKINTVRQKPDELKW